jgi:hypothetical protein
MTLDTHVPRRLLRRIEAASYVTSTWGVPLSPRTLAKLAVVGGGPLFRKAGRYPLYEIADLDSWALSKIGPKQRSTSDRGAQKSQQAPAHNARGPPP